VVPAVVGARLAGTGLPAGCACGRTPGWQC